MTDALSSEFDPTDVNDPEVEAEVRQAVEQYEQALVANDIEALEALFWSSPYTVRYGPNEVLYGDAEISAFRRARDARGLDRRVRRLQITTFGRDMATANLEFERKGSDSIGRQSQTWVRFSEGWRVVSAHVSMMPRPDGAG